jgi:hypothetical protein
MIPVGIVVEKPLKDTFVVTKYMIICVLHVKMVFDMGSKVWITENVGYVIKDLLIFIPMNLVILYAMIVGIRHVSFDVLPLKRFSNGYSLEYI